MSTPIDLSTVKTWHYAVSDKDRAQTTAGGAKALYKAGTIKPETLVWCTGMGDWKPVKEIPGLQAYLTTAPPSASTTTTAVPTSTPEAKGDGTDESGWHYLDASQTQVGPISLAELSERISNGQITNETYGWRTGLTDWAPLSSIPELVPVFGNEWFYVDKQKERVGPVKWSDIIDKYHRFELNHTTLAWRQGLAEWKLLSEISDFDGKLGITTDQTANNAAAAAKTKKQVDEETKKRKREQKKAKKKQGKWVATEEHANVYVQGLPEDTNVEEAHEFFKKAGLIKEDPKTTWKIKLYEDSTGKKKG